MGLEENRPGAQLSEEVDDECKKWCNVAVGGPLDNE